MVDIKNQLQQMSWGTCVHTDRDPVNIKIFKTTLPRLLGADFKIDSRGDFVMSHLIHSNEVVQVFFFFLVFE